jgi:calcineurin-like phosphoesterase family protein
MERKPTFFTSDWHINHGNCIKFDNRPFSNTIEMHEALIHNFNKVVPENGITYFLGDIATGPTAIVNDVITRLNGTKVCIVGNHDKPYAAMYNCGFDVVLNAATLYIHNQKVTMSHCPLFGVFREDTDGMLGATSGENWHGEHKNTKFTVKDEGQFHLSGHIHSPNGGKSKKILGRQYDVGCVANRYTPVHIGVIESWIMKTLNEEKKCQ